LASLHQGILRRFGPENNAFSNGDGFKLKCTMENP